MSQAETGYVNGIWKWIAAILAALMIGGVPGYINQFVNAPTGSEVDLIRERQQIVLQEIATQRAQIAQLTQEISLLREDLREHTKE